MSLKDLIIKDGEAVCVFHPPKTEKEHGWAVLLASGKILQIEGGCLAVYESRDQARLALKHWVGGFVHGHGIVPVTVTFVRDPNYSTEIVQHRAAIATAPQETAEKEGE